MNIIEDLKTYCELHISKYLETPENENKYPKKIIEDLAELGLFGLNIPKKYGGLEHGLPVNVAMMKELGKVWLTLPALFGTHLRANMYFIASGTKEQKEKYLPLMANGKAIFSHAYHEKATKNLLKISTTLEKIEDKYYLNGSKDWVTNSKNANYHIVIARNLENNNKPVAVIVKSNNKGVKVEDELVRPGIKGISLTSIFFNNIEINPHVDIIGGENYSVDDFIKKYKLGSSLSFSARSIGAAESIIEHTKKYINSFSQRENGHEIIAYKFALMYSKYLSANNALTQIVSNFSNLPNKTASAYLTKVYCSNMLQDVIKEAIMLKGGYGYASKEGFLQRMYRDSASLPLIDTPNDILIYRSGKELLNS